MESLGIFTGDCRDQMREKRKLRFDIEGYWRQPCRYRKGL